MTAEVEALKAAARQRLAEGQGALDLGLNTAGVDGEPLQIIASKASHLWDALCCGLPGARIRHGHRGR